MKESVYPNFLSLTTSEAGRQRVGAQFGANFIVSRSGSHVLRDSGLNVGNM